MLKSVYVKFNQKKVVYVYTRNLVSHQHSENYVFSIYLWLFCLLINSGWYVLLYHKNYICTSEILNETSNTYFSGKNDDLVPQSIFSPLGSGKIISSYKKMLKCPFLYSLPAHRNTNGYCVPKNQVFSRFLRYKYE